MRASSVDLLSPDGPWILVAITAVGGVLLCLTVRYLSMLWHVRALPSIPTLFISFEPGLRAKLPQIPWISPVEEYTIYQPWLKYEKARSDLIALPAFLSTSSSYITSSPTLAQWVNSRTEIFQKPIYMKRYTALDLFGPTVLSAQNGPEDRRHSAIIKRCLGDRAMDTVWEAMQWATEVFVLEEIARSPISVAKDIESSMSKLTLLTIGRQGFGMCFPWHMSESEEKDMPFGQALDLVEQGVLLQIILPAWLLPLIPSTRIKRYLRARETFLSHLVRMIAAKRVELASMLGIEVEDFKKVPPPSDLLGALVHSQLTAEEEARLAGGQQRVVGLRMSEIIGNMWILIFAGHEVTGHALSFTLAYLALYPEWQEEVYKEIVATCGEMQPTYRDMIKLPLCQAVWLEALRLKDVVATIMKHVNEDVVVPYTTWTSAGELQQRTHLVRKGSLFIIDSSAAQLNPHHWGEDAMVFNPRRHLGQTPPYVAFSLGQRQCIGKRLAEVEMTSFISTICRNWRFAPVKLRPSETWEEMKFRIIDTATEEISFQPGKFDLKFERR